MVAEETGEETGHWRGIKGKSIGTPSDLRAREFRVQHGQPARGLSRRLVINSSIFGGNNVEFCGGRKIGWKGCGIKSENETVEHLELGQGCWY